MKVEFFNPVFASPEVSRSREFIGAQHDLLQAYAGATLRVGLEGCDVWQYVHDRPTTLHALARDLTRRRPDVIVVKYVPSSAAFIERVIAGCRRLAPDVALVASTASSVPAATTSSVDYWITDGHEAALGRLVATLSGGRFADSWPELTAGGTIVRPSPYRTGYLPALAAGVAGVEVARRLPGGSVAYHEFEDVLLDLDWIDRHVPQSTTVKLVGLFDGTDSTWRADLWPRLADRPRSRTPLSTELDLDALDGDLCHSLARAAILSVLCRVDVSRRPVPAGDRLAGALAAAADEGLSVHVHLTASEADLEALDDLMGVLEEVDCPFSYGATRSGDGWALARAVERQHPAASRSLTARISERKAGEGVGAVHRLVTGRYGEAPAYVEQPGDVWWRRDAREPGSAEWLIGLMGFTSHLVTEQDVEGQGGLPVFGPVSTSISSAEDPASTLFVNERHEITRAPYRTGSRLFPTTHSILSFEDRDDVDAFLADADLARAEGLLQLGFVHPLSDIADACRWLAAGGCARPSLRRLVVCDDGQVTTTLGAPPIGRVGDDFEVLLRRARAEALERKDRRGCASCPMSALCSKCGCLPSWLAEAEYCAARRARPWLSQYVAIPEAVRSLSLRHPGLVGEAVTSLVRVSGFGGRFFYDGPSSEPVAGEPVLLEVQGSLYLYDVGTHRPLKVTPDLAAVAEAVLATRDTAKASCWLAEFKRLPEVEAERGIAQSLGLLRGKALPLPLPGAGS